MSKKSSIIIWVVLGLLAVSATGVYFYLKKQEQLAQRHHLACDVLKAGMSKEEVISTLNQVGNFTMSEGDWLGGLIELNINFTDSKVRDKYGYFSLFFINYKYVRAYVRHGSDNFEGICDFYNVSTKSITETPTRVP